MTNTTVNEFVEPSNNIQEFENKKIRVYPNPFSQSCTIDFGQKITSTIKLYNLFGKEVKTVLNFQGDKLLLERDNLPAGIYYLNVENLSSKVKIVIQ